MTSKEFLRLTGHPPPSPAMEVNIHRLLKSQQTSHDKLQTASSLLLGLNSNLSLEADEP